MLSFVQKFEKLVESGLKECGVPFSENLENAKPLIIGVAVSGGADSISLLVSLSEILKKYNLPLFVISVNHNIRQAEETAGDALFVMDVCQKLQEEGKSVVCKVVELERGQVAFEAERRGNGIEEAARFLRYEAFETFIAENNIDFLCLAHNKNDQLETLLMRFLQGSFLESASGIRNVRGKYIRPILGIERCDIERYLKEKGFSWRTDSTNLETDYLRNRIRLNLVPFLDEEFPGWKNGVLSGMEKAGDDEELIKTAMGGVEILEDVSGDVSVEAESFVSVPRGIQTRVLLKMCGMILPGTRVPYVFVQDVISAIFSYNADYKTGCCTGRTVGRTVKKYFSQLCVIYDGEKIFVKKASKVKTDLIFSDIIEETGRFLFPFGEIEIDGDTAYGYNLRLEGKCVMTLPELPVVIRNCRMDDEIKTGDGGLKTVADIFSDWHLKDEERKLIPVVQCLKKDSQELVAVIGEVCGYKNWIVK